MPLQKYIESKASQLKGGCITSVDRGALGTGSFSMVQNLRGQHPSFKRRAGQRKLHSVSDSNNKVLSLYQFKKPKTEEDMFFAQMSDGDVLRATNSPPTVTTGEFGEVVFEGSATQVPASWSNFQEKLIYSNGHDQHQIYAGEKTYIENFIVYKGDGAIPIIPEIGEDYSDKVNNDETDKVAILDALDSYTNYHCAFIKTSVPAESFRFVVEKANSNDVSASIYYWNGSWTAAASFEDNTNEDGSLAQTGTMTFTMPSDIITKYMFGYNGFWYQLRFDGKLSDEVEISSITYSSDWMDIINVWNGFTDDPVEIQLEQTNAWATYSAAIVDLDEFPVGNKIMIACTDPSEAFYVDPEATPNTESVAITSLKYWNGSDYVSVSNLNDSSSGLSQAGWITFARQSDIQPTQFGTSKYYAYWYELIFDGTLSIGTQIGIENMPYYGIEGLGNSQCNCVWKDRIVYTFDQYPEYLYISAAYNPFFLNGDDFAVMETGDGRSNKIVAMRKFHNELLVWQEEKGPEGGTTTLFEGYSPLTFGKLIISTKIGTFSNKSVDVVEGVYTATATDEVLKHLAFFLSRTGVCVTDGKTISLISDDVQNYFDQSKPECIRRGYEQEHWLVHDSSERVIRIGLVSGFTATIPNIFLIYDYIDRTWSFDELGQELSCATEVEATSGNSPIIQVGGGVDDGFIYQLNYGKNDVSDPIDSYLTIEFNGEGSYILLRELILRTASNSGNIILTIEKNGVEIASRILSMEAERSNQIVRRHRENFNIVDQQLSITLRNNELDTDMILESLGVLILLWEGR